MNYYVKYVTKENEEKVERFTTKESAIAYYRNHLSEMTYGYISDEEALDVAETVKRDYEEELERENTENLEALFEMGLGSLLINE